MIQKPSRFLVVAKWSIQKLGNVTVIICAIAKPKIWLVDEEDGETFSSSKACETVRPRLRLIEANNPQALKGCRSMV